MAQEISMIEWAESALEYGNLVSFEVELLEIVSMKVVRVRPVIKVNGEAVWEGKANSVSVKDTIGLSGFALDGPDLVLKNYEDVLYE